MENRPITRRGFLYVALGAAGAIGAAEASRYLRGNGAPEDAPDVAVPAFDADRAFGYLERQVEIGFRVPGTPAHRECRDYLRDQLARSLGSATLQPFVFEDGGERLPMWNVLAEHDPENPRKVLLCAHWDTRPTADKESDPESQQQPIAGANDGASGVAVLLEIASQLRRSPPPVGVRFVLFDGEDLGPDSDRMYLGAKHYARNLPKPNPEWGVLLDMVGDKDLGIWRERTSQASAPEVNDRLFRAAREAGHGDVFHDEVKWSIMDDHIPLLQAGVPVIDLIDFDYPYWHTLEDTVDKCSPDSLRAVGEAVLRALYTA